MKRYTSLLAALSIILLIGKASLADVPSDGWIVWASNRFDGRYEIYRMTTDGNDIVRLTYSGGMVPAWSPNGVWFSYYSELDSYVHVMHWDGSGDKKLCHRGALDQGNPAFWMHDSSGLVCANFSGDDMEFYLVNPDSCESELLFRKSDFRHLRSTRFELGGITHDGRFLIGWAFSLYSEGYQGDNGFFDSNQATVALDLNDKSKVYYFGPGCQSATPPAGDWIYHVSRQYPTLPDIARMNMNDIMTRESYELELANEDGQWGHEYMPSISNDNNWMVYGATTGCHDLYTCDYEIFIHRLGSGISDRTRLTYHTAVDNFPSIHIGDLPKLQDGEDGSCEGNPDSGQTHKEYGDNDDKVRDGCGCLNVPGNLGLSIPVIILYMFFSIIRRG